MRSTSNAGQKRKVICVSARLFSAVMRGCIAKHSEKSLRALTLFFVEKILVVEAAISEISVQRFRGQPLLFSDSAAKLKEQLDFAEKALELFNSLAREAKFLELNRDEISSRLRAEVDQQVLRSVLVARGEMLAVFGNEADLRTTFNQLVATTKSTQDNNDRATLPR